MARISFLFFLLLSAAQAAGGPTRAPAVVNPQPKKEIPKSIEKPTLRIYQVGADRFRFESCNAEKICEAIGREEGYSKQELAQWEKFRKNSAMDIAPLMGIVAGFGLLVGAIVLMPVAVTAVVGASLLAGFAYFFSQTPQVKAGMPNDVFKEFEADPSLVPQLKGFLREVDEGLVTSDRDPRVFTGVDLKNQVSPEVRETNPSVPAK